MAEEAVSGVLELANATVPGLGLLTWVAGMGVRRLRRGRATESVAASLKADESVDPVTELASSISLFARSGIPIVIAVEDLHLADVGLGRLLADVVAGAAAPILVITTSWPGFADSAESAGQSSLSSTPSNRHHEVDLTDDQWSLTVADRATVMAAVLPGLDRQLREQLAATTTNPLSIELVGSMQALRRHVQRGSELTAADLSDFLAEDPTAIYQRMWDMLPDDVRRSLAVAALASPAGVHHLRRRGDRMFETRTWLPDDVVQAAAAADLGIDPEVLASTLAGRDVYRWVRMLTDATAGFHDVGQHLVAADHPRQVGIRRDLDAFLGHLTTATVQSWAEESVDVAAQLLVTLAAEGFTTVTDTVLSAALEVTDRLAQVPNTTSLERIVVVARTMLAAPDTDLTSPTARTLRHRSARAVGVLGRVGEAVDHLTRLLDDSSQVLGPDHPDTLTTRNNLASRLGESGRVDDAVEQLTRLLDDCTRVLGADHPDTLATRNNLASWLGESGRVDDAVEQLTRLLDDRIRVLGADHPDTLTTRNNLASRLGEAGRVDEAVEQFTRLLDDRTRVSGPDHPGTLTTRTDLASCLGDAGRVDEAVEQFTRLLDDRTRVSGPDHPDTLATRRDLADWLGGFPGSG